MPRPLSFAGLVVSIVLVLAAARSAYADVVLDFSDVAPGTLLVFSPYTSQGFSLTSTAGGFVFNSPDTGNGAPQVVGNNPFYAGANGFASFAPATITLTRLDAQPFSLLSIDLARNFAFDPPPTVTFTGAISGGGSITESFSVTSTSPPLVFQGFTFAGFTDVTSVSWLQPASGPTVHQFANVHLGPVAALPEPSSVELALLAIALLAAPAAVRGVTRVAQLATCRS